MLIDHVIIAVQFYSDLIFFFFILIKFNKIFCNLIPMNSIEMKKKNLFGMILV